jgi:ribosomal protein S18 acetylase RimI-like enzyme
MTPDARALSIERHDGTDLQDRRDLLLEVYAEVYADRLNDPFFSRTRYWERLEGYAARAGFTLVTGLLSDEAVGYALGYTLPAGSGWWRGLRSPATPGELLETGSRTFALTEIMVREEWRRRGYARELHDALLAGRQEERATLLVLPENTAARSAYLSWGWRKIGELQPFDDSPIYDAMVRGLPL